MQKLLVKIARFFRAIGPIVLSALSLLISFCLLQPIACWFDPTFSLLANRGVGKVVFTIMILLHIMLLVTTASRAYRTTFWQTNISFLGTVGWIKQFFMFFSAFFVLHSLILAFVCYTDNAVFIQETLSRIVSKSGSLIWGFVATFFLAWTEEVIFRGTLFTFLAQKLPVITSALITSLIFALAHNLTNPLMLITQDWRLGLGLFLLGMLLNTVFAITNKLYIGMGIHAGLVFVKVVLRRIPCITYVPTLAWWIDIDLRQSLFVHFLFLLTIITLILVYQKQLRHKTLH